MDQVVFLRHYVNNQEVNLYQAHRNSTDLSKLTITHKYDPISNESVECECVIELEHIHGGLYSEREENHSLTFKGTYIELTYDYTNRN